VRGEKPGPKPTSEASSKGNVITKPPPAPEAFNLPDQQTLTTLLRQLREAIPGALAAYIVDCQARKPLASSTAHKLAETDAGFEPFCGMACDNLKGNVGFRVREHYLSTHNYLIGIQFISPSHRLVTICPPSTQLGLLITELRRAREKTANLLAKESK
jgi:hypothetical protein